jgi:hypothetical protein
VSPILGIWASQNYSRYSLPTSYDSIATVTVGSGGAANVEFTSIPSTYTHLQVRALTRETYGSFPGFSYLQFNNDTGNNYAVHLISGNGSTASTGVVTSAGIIYTGPVGGTTANTFGGMIIDILDYANTNKYKTARYLTGADNNSSGEIRFGSGLWQSTNAITSIKLFGNNGNWQQYTQFALYGIKGA